jgi:hypothetical protein
MVFVSFDWKAARAALMAVRTAGSLREGMAGGVVEGFEVMGDVVGKVVVGVVKGVGVLIRKVLDLFKDRKKKVDCKTYDL